MKEIQFYYTPRDLQKVRPSVIYRPDGSFLSRLTARDKQIIEENWKRFSQKRGFYRGKLGTLWDTQNNTLTFCDADYGIWRAAEDTRAQRSLSDFVYNNFRVSSLGIAVLTSDNKILVQERSQAITVGGMLDSSAAGFCGVEDGSLNPEKSLEEKLNRELNLTPAQFGTPELRGIHSAVDYFSGMLAYKVRTNVPSSEITSNPDYVAKLYIIDSSELPEYIADNFLNRRMIGDGCATLLASLEPQDFDSTVSRINLDDTRIRFGQLVNGEFKPIGVQR